MASRPDPREGGGASPDCRAQPCRAFEGEHGVERVEWTGDAMTGEADAARVLAEPRAGALRGWRLGGVACWRGVPYAAPPVGPLRLRGPRPVVPWPGVREAMAFGASAPQPFSLAEQVLGLHAHEPAAEDCLSLNIWSQGPAGAARPVMVWLHGGAFLTGAGSDDLYDGHRFAARGDVVVVTINYRLGPLGFLHLRGCGVPEADENLGLRDQIAALAWVRDNIGAFGGDPACVTLFGQSAGAMAIGALLGAPAARGLFHRAILQSGAAQHVHDRAGADRIARRFLRALGGSRAGEAALREAEPARLLAAARPLLAAISLTGLPFQPVVDGDILPQRPLAAVRAGSAADVPLLLGTTRDELALYGVVGRRDTAAPLLKRWRRLHAGAALARALGPRRLLRLRRAYGMDAGMRDDLPTDVVFRMPALQLAAAQDAHAPVFVYRFDWRSPAYDGAVRACHALDLPFVWNNLDKPSARLLTRDEPGTRALAEAMQDAWIAFARNGDPATPKLPLWPRYGAPRRATMIFDTACRVEDDPQGAQRAAWDDRGA